MCWDRVLLSTHSINANILNYDLSFHTNIRTLTLCVYCCGIFIIIINSFHYFRLTLNLHTSQYINWNVWNGWQFWSSLSRRWKNKDISFSMCAHDVMASMWHCSQFFKSTQRWRIHSHKRQLIGIDLRGRME